MEKWYEDADTKERLYEYIDEIVCSPSLGAQFMDHVYKWLPTDEYYALMKDFLVDVDLFGYITGTED